MKRQKEEAVQEKVENNEILNLFQGEKVKNKPPAKIATAGKQFKSDNIV